jgi:hypothetical protein
MSLISWGREARRSRRCGVHERTWLRLFEHWYVRSPGPYDLGAISLAHACPSTCGAVGRLTRSTP